MERSLEVLLSQAILFCCQIAYVAAFRESFERQLDAFDSAPIKCFGVGFALILGWALLGTMLGRAGLLGVSSVVLVAFVSPVFVAVCAGSAVCLTGLAGRVSRQDPRPYPFAYLMGGTLVAFMLAFVPFLSPYLITLTAAAGLGAVVRHERAARKNDDPRLGRGGFAWLAAAAAVFCLAVSLSGRRMARQAAASIGDMPEPPAEELPSPP